MVDFQLNFGSAAIISRKDFFYISYNRFRRNIFDKYDDLFQFWKKKTEITWDISEYRKDMWIPSDEDKYNLYAPPFL